MAATPISVGGGAGRDVPGRWRSRTGYGVQLSRLAARTTLSESGRRAELPLRVGGARPDDAGVEDAIDALAISQVEPEVGIGAWGETLRREANQPWQRCGLRRRLRTVPSLELKRWPPTSVQPQGPEQRVSQASPVMRASGRNGGRGRSLSARGGRVAVVPGVGGQDSNSEGCPYCGCPTASTASGLPTGAAPAGDRAIAAGAVQEMPQAGCAQIDLHGDAFLPASMRIVPPIMPDSPTRHCSPGCQTLPSPVHWGNGWG